MSATQILVQYRTERDLAFEAFDLWCRLEETECTHGVSMRWCVRSVLVWRGYCSTGPFFRSVLRLAKQWADLP